MSSQLQIEANRRNSRKSTGPRTPAGKAISSHDSLGSGIYAESQIIIGERQSDFEDLAAAFHSRYHPDSPDQQALLDIAIHSEWILRRLRSAETGLWDYYIDDHDFGADTTGLGRAFDCNDRTFARLQRRLDSLQRNFQRALKELKHFQVDRPASQLHAHPPAQPQPLPATPTQIGFVSSPVQPQPPNPATTQILPPPSLTQLHAQPPARPQPLPATPSQIGFVSSPVQPQPPNPATTQILPPPSLTQLHAQPPAQPQPLPATPSRIGFVSSPVQPQPPNPATTQILPPPSLTQLHAQPPAQPQPLPATPTRIGFVSSPVQPQPPNPATTQILPPPSLTQLHAQPPAQPQPLPATPTRIGFVSSPVQPQFPDPAATQILPPPSLTQLHAQPSAQPQPLPTPSQIGFVSSPVQPQPPDPAATQILPPPSLTHSLIVLLFIRVNNHSRENAMPQAFAPCRILKTNASDLLRDLDLTDDELGVPPRPRRPGQTRPPGLRPLPRWQVHRPPLRETLPPHPRHL